MELGGKHFEARVEEGQKVKKGDLLISFGVDAMKAAGYPCTASMIACSIDGCQRVKPIAEGAIRSGTAVQEGKG